MRCHSHHMNCGSRKWITRDRNGQSFPICHRGLQEGYRPGWHNVWHSRQMRSEGYPVCKAHNGFDQEISEEQNASRNQKNVRQKEKKPRAPAVTENEVGVDLKRAGLKVAWVGAEALGNMLGSSTSSSELTNEEPKKGQESGQKSLPREMAIESVKKDYDEGYFVSGAGKLDAYAPDCRFADPFASFRGVERFKKNVSNLGAMLSDVNIEILSWEEQENSLRTSWRFSGVVNLPWKPLLAAAGSTVHVFDPDTGYVVEHLENWDTEPTRVLRTLLRPSSKLPKNQWEVFMNSVYDGDIKGMWLGISCVVGKISASLLGLSVVTSIITGERAPGALVLLGIIGAVLITEVLKFSGGLQGGETGTGGRF